MKYSLRSLMVVVLVIPPLLAFYYWLATDMGAFGFLKDPTLGMPLTVTAVVSLVLWSLVYASSTRPAP